MITRRFLWVLLIGCAIFVQGDIHINDDNDIDDDVNYNDDGNDEFVIDHEEQPDGRFHLNSDLSCRHVQDTIVCEFSIPKMESQQPQAFTVCEDNMCVQAVINVFPDPATTKSDVHHVETQQMDSTTETETHTSSDSKVQVGTQIYEPPFSQYGPTIEAALNSKPADLTSASYPYWIVNTLGFAHRGDGTNAEQLEMAIQVMSTAKGYYVNYYERSPTEDDYEYAQLGIASSFVAIGESQSLLGHNAEAMAQFKSAQSIYETLLTRTDLLSETRDAIHLFLADVLIRLGVLVADKSIMEVDGYGRPLESMAPLLHSSETMLSQAVDIYRTAVSRAGPDLLQNQLHLANALQHYGSTLIMSKGDMAQVLDLQKQAFVMYEDLLLHTTVDTGKATPTPPDVDRHSIVMFMATLLNNMADSALQAGLYTECNQYYSQAMDWYMNNNLAAPEVYKSFLSEDDEIVQQYEMALADYQASASTELEADALYEADIHSTLGALKLAKDDDLTAGFSHIHRAIDTYELYGEEHLAAAAYLTLATGLFRDGKFAESSKARQRGVDIYRRVVGEGNYPFLSGMPDEWTMEGGGGGGGMMDDVGPWTTSDVQTPPPPDTAQVKKNKHKADHVGVVHEHFIDLDAVQQSQRNATVKEEL